MTDSTSTWPPPTGWQKGRVLRPAAARALGVPVGCAFKALPTPGAYAPIEDTAAWSLHCGLDAQIDPLDIWMLHNGLAVKSGPSDELMLALYAVEPDALCGYAHSSMAQPSLFTPELPLHTEEDGQWLHTGRHYVALCHSPISEGIRFALAVSANSQSQALNDAREALQRDPRDELRNDMARCAKLLRAAQSQQADAMLMTEAYDTLASALRAPQEAIPHRWSESGTEPGSFSVNALYPLITAWCPLDITVAEDLFRAACSGMDPSGFVPARMRPDGNHDRQAMAWPTLVLCAKTISDHGASDAFYEYALPCLATYLEHALQRFRKDNNYIWRSPEESFIPETFDLDLATVDLTTFLLSEIELFLEMTAAHDRNDLVTPIIRMHTDRLNDHLTNHLWDDNDHVFRDGYANGQPIKRTTLSALLPLMLGNLAAAYCAPTLKRLQQQIAARNQGGLGLWEWWESDPQRPPAPALHQAFVLHAARRSGHEETARRLETKLRDALEQGFSREQVIPDDLSSSSETTSNPPSSSIMGAALAVSVVLPLDTGSSERALVSPAVRWLDRHRLAVLGTTVGLVLVALATVIMSYQFKRTPTAVEMEAISGLAERYYYDGRHEKAAALYRGLVQSAPDNRLLHFRLANALYRQGLYAEAEHHYRRALTEEMPSPRILRNLAITLHRQGKHREAAHYFEIIATQYPQSYPEMAAQAQTALDILTPLVEAD